MNPTEAVFDPHPPRPLEPSRCSSQKRFLAALSLSLSSFSLSSSHPLSLSLYLTISLSISFSRSLSALALSLLKPGSVPGSFPRPYTLHSSPFTLHPTPCTPHPTPYTLHPTPYTLHRSLLPTSAAGAGREAAARESSTPQSPAHWNLAHAAARGGCLRV